MPVINVNEGVNVSVTISEGNAFDVTVNSGVLNGGVPGGNANTLQYNNNGVFGGVPFTSYANGVLTLGSNANISITGGTSNQVLTTNGSGVLSWANAASGTGTVTSVTGNGSGIGFSLSGTVTTSGNITLATPTAADLRTTLTIGNVANLNLNGNASQFLTGAGTFVAGNAGTVTTVNTSGSGLGFTLGGGPITSSGTVTLTIPTATDLRTSLTIGNVANINLNGNGSEVLAGNGAWIAVGSGSVTQVNTSGSGLGFSLTGGPITNTGTVTLNIPTDTALRTSLNIGNIANLNLNGNTSQYLNGAGSWVAIATGEPIANAVIATTNAPMGFNARTALTDTTISFDNTSRQFTITPTGATFDVWVSGTKYTKSTAESITIANTTGSHYVYYSNTGTLSNSVDFYDLGNVAAVSIIYWNSDQNSAQLFLEERHSTGLTPTEHRYLHTTRGAVVQFVPSVGFTLTATTTGNGDNNVDAQVSLSSGTIWDEDIQVNIVNSLTPTANTFQQNLSQLPAFYRSGSGGAWRIDTPTAYPFKQGTTRPTYNLNTAGNWTTPDVTNNYYFIQWICATNNLNYPVISILGQTQFSNLNPAQLYAFGDLDLTGLPLPELRPLYGLVFETANSYNNTPKARLRSYSDVRLATGVTASLGVNAVDVAFRETPATVFASDATSNTAWTNVIGNFAGNINYTGANVTLGPVANLHIAGGSLNQVLTTNGTGTLSWTTPNVGTVTSVDTSGSGLGFSLSGGPITSTGTVALTIPTDTALRTSLNIGNVANLNLNGNVSQFLTGTGTFAAGNAGTVTSVVGDGSGLGFSLTGTVTSSGNITLAVPTDTTLRTNLNIGNVANINLNGNGSQVLAGNGSWVAQSGGGGATDILSPFLLMGA